MELGPALAAAAGLRTISLLTPVWRWCFLMRAIGVDISWKTGVHVGLVGRFFSLALPGSLGLDSARLYYGGKIDPEKSAEVVSSMIMDRVIGAAALFLLGAVAIAGPVGRSLPSFGAVWLLGGLAGVPMTILAMGRARGYLARVADALLAYRRRPSAVAWCFAASIIGHLVGFLAAWYAFRAYGSTISASVVLTLQPLVALAWLLPITPQGLGVADSVAEWAYLQAGFDSGAEVLLALRVVGVVTGAVCGLAYLVPLRAARR